MKPTQITHFVMMGDSLSDRGTLDHQYLLGCIPMASLSGLQQHSPLGRFTNGLAWNDHLSARLANQFLITDFARKDQLSPGQRDRDDTDIADDIIDHDPLSPRSPLDPSDISDDVLDRDPRVENLEQNGYFLNNDRSVKFEGRDFVRNYDEGGLTAYDYSWMPSTSVSRFVSRIILSTLDYMREKLLSYDRQHELSRAHKAQTLIIEWSGANDLITVNARPSDIEVKRAVAARVKNVEELIKNGYCHFVLFNLPNLALTPRYQAKSEAERLNAQEASASFNKALYVASQNLTKLYPHASIEVFDVDGLFAQVYQAPADFGFDQSKLTHPYVQSADFKINADRTSPAPGYMFWDDVHPTAKLHAILAERFYQRFQLEYNFSAPVEEAVHLEELHISAHALCAAFIEKYGKKLADDKSGFFGHFRQSNIKFRHASLEAILDHALNGGGHRTREVLIELQWIDKLGNLNLNIPALKEAMAQVDLNASRPIAPAL